MANGGGVELCAFEEYTKNQGCWARISDPWFGTSFQTMQLSRKQNSGEQTAEQATKRVSFHFYTELNFRLERFNSIFGKTTVNTL